MEGCTSKYMRPHQYSYERGLAVGLEAAGCVWEMK